MSASNPAQVVARRRFPRPRPNPAELPLLSPVINWRFLLDRTLLYAANHLNRWRWRGSLGGVLPDGFDASSIAAEAIYDLLKNPSPRVAALADRGRVESAKPAAAPSTGEQAPKVGLSCPSGPVTAGLRPVSREPELATPWPSESHIDTLTLSLQRILERRVRTIVNRLYHRAENRLLRNEPDLSMAVLDDDDVVPIITQVADRSPGPDAILSASESTLDFLFFKRQFAGFIRREPRLLKLFELYCQDCHRPDNIAARLKLSPSTVRNLEKRFIRRWTAFHKRRNSPQTRN